jgi:hypothetical protein
MDPDPPEVTSYLPDFAPAHRVIPGRAEVPGADIRHAERASDGDRDKVIGHLRRSFELGRLPKEAFDARMGAASSAVTRPELAALITDLPAPALPRRRGPHLPASNLGRTWWHIGWAFTAIVAMFVPAIVTWHASGYPVTYGSGSGAWTGTEHPGPMVALTIMFVLLGLCGLIVDLFFWVVWWGDTDG